MGQYQSLKRDIMTIISKEDLFPERIEKENRVGMGSKRNIDKNGLVYHVITTSWRKKRLFDKDLAKYRQDLLCELCSKNGITILFSATMPTHTHEVFITPSWELLSKVIRTLNSNVAKYAKRHLSEKIEERGRVFSDDPAYVLVDSIDYLMYLGMYIFCNQQHLKNDGKSVPDSCFWMFEKGYFPEPYNAEIYQKLFGMNASEILALYKAKTAKEVWRFARERFSEWTEEDNRRLFLRSYP